MEKQFVARLGQEQIGSNTMLNIRVLERLRFRERERE
jgi:hypothetical protein